MRQLQRDVTDLQVRVQVLESERPGRKPMPMLATKQRDVCAVDPDSDSSHCEYASLYRYQHGCLGVRCRARQHEAYERRKVTRLAKKALSRSLASKKTIKKTAKAITPAKKRVVKKAPAKRVPTKRVAKAS